MSDKPIKCAVVAPDGTVTEQELNFEGFQKAVGGYVQLLNLAPGIWVYVNEDGMTLGLPPNEKATAFCHHLGPNISIDDYIKGPMVVCGANGNRPVTAVALELLSKIQI